jgi:hypothetical protein
MAFLRVKLEGNNYECVNINQIVYIKGVTEPLLPPSVEQNYTRISTLQYHWDDVRSERDVLMMIDKILSNERSGIDWVTMQYDI